jgi:hypothetical protein
MFLSEGLAKPSSNSNNCWASSYSIVKLEARTYDPKEGPNCNIAQLVIQLAVGIRHTLQTSRYLGDEYRETEYTKLLTYYITTENK